MDLPPLPPGFSLDSAAPELPPLPPGFALDGESTWLGRKAQVAKEAVARGVTQIVGLPTDAANLLYEGMIGGANLVRDKRGLPPLVNDEPLPGSPELRSVTKGLGLTDNPEYAPRTGFEKYLSRGVEGATAGALTGGLLGVGAAGAAVSGLGAGAGTQFGEDLTSGPKTPEWMKTAVPIATGIAGGFAAPAAANAVGKTAKALFANDQPALAPYRDAGIDARLAGSASGNRTAQALEGKLMDVPGAGRIRQQLQATVDEVKDKLDEIAAGYGQAATKTQAGETIKEGATNAATRFATRQEKLYTDAFAKVGANTPTTLTAVTALKNQLAAELAKAPTSRAASIKPALDRIAAIEADAAATGSVDFETFRKIRTDLGRLLKQPVLNESTGAANDNLRALYGALTDDMKNTAASVSPEALTAIKTADRYTRFYKNVNEPILKSVTSSETAEKAFNYAMAGGRDGASRLLKLRSNMTPDEWGDVASAVLRRMGTDEAGNFSIARFLDKQTGWSSLNEASRRALFGDTSRGSVPQALDGLVKVAEGIKTTAATANTSKTAGTAMLIQSLSGAAVGSGAALAGNLDTAMGAVVGAAAPAAAAGAAARLLTTPAFVKWLSTPAPLEGIPARVRALGSLAAMKPEIADDIRVYLDAVNDQMSSTGQPSPSMPRLPQ